MRGNFAYRWRCRKDRVQNVCKRQIIMILLPRPEDARRP